MGKWEKKCPVVASLCRTRRVSSEGEAQITQAICRGSLDAERI